MFTDDLSEIWDSSEFQDSFIKDYFSMEKVSKVAKNPVDKSLHFKNVSKKSLKRLHCESEDEDAKKSDLRNSNDIFNSSGTAKKKKKISNIPPENKFVNNHLNNLQLSEKKSTDDSSVLKSKKKRKRKLTNKVEARKQTLLNSSHLTTSKLVNDSKDLQKEGTNPVSNYLEGESSSYQNKLCQKLQGAKFRYLNEMLYTSSGKDALSYFQENKEEFEDYHVGYQSQVSKWPINPVDIIIEELHHINKESIIADLGCGEAKIAESFPKRTVHSFDLIALKDCVRACDMANVPLPSASVDVVVFCLSLMGTNWKDYLKEGHRLLKLGAELKIAEIESRIDDLNSFIKNIQAYGFSLVNKDMSHKMFVFLNFKKVKNKVKSSKILNVTLKPCLYKKR